MNDQPQELLNAKFNALMEEMREGVILLNTQQLIVNANATACEMTGYEVKEMIGKHVSDILNILSDEDTMLDPDLICPPGDLDRDGVIFKADSVSLINKNENVRVVNVKSRKIAQGSKINLGAMVIITDVFKEGELERMKTDFVSMAVHMLRTPLTIVKGFLNNLLKIETIKKLNPDEISNLSSAIAGADNLDTLIENLLHLSEIQRGSFTIHASLVSYDGLLASMVTEYKPKVDGKGLQLIYIPPLYELPRLELDFARMREVLRNLLDNAMKFTEQGGIEITVSKEEDFIHTVVKDTGKGIPESNLEYIFTKFYRIKSPLEMEQGLGLGLFISKKIIEAHGGKIWVDSIEGQGSMFHFTLPIPKVLSTDTVL
jgi:PAS domain S-box-containing protein